MRELAIQLFKALDDMARYQYYLYEKGEGEYPSGKSVEALSVARSVLHIESVALRKMEENLAGDLLSEVDR